ncbi:alpha-xenorhabdolysin family binary toxin subunit B [Pseudomonas fontis]|uniref:Alpha-xenorhabdolysin family binary toxin subunit B n=1 Tax=Pseudomonas fontis TaxID=2942633 RepID=A0ABT5NNZ9_9PSED|nr:alpha-xenorhabdolysin family binary toxin subunit B [Pseudomonas fontis]MDD0974364.1 alpha-xenorhabdolysin family binary toxin subunit B [Pseudomonas fontis]MDD0989906.1 alpha-xenorhabdolysin family binary toxin subunit B [Pseudomonas fontis]
MNGIDVSMLSEVPDFALMRSIYAELQSVVPKKVHGLNPSIRGGVLDNYKNIGRADSILRDGLIFGIAALNDLGVEATLAELSNLRSLPAIDPARTEREIRMIEQDLEFEGLKLRAELNERGAEVNNQLKKLRAYQAPVVDARTIELAQEMRALEKALESEHAKAAKLKAEVDALEVVILAFKRPSLSSILEGVIPPREKIEAAVKLATLTKPDLDVLNVLLDSIREGIEFISAGQSYADVVKTHTRAVRQVEATNHSISTLSQTKGYAELEVVSLSFVPQVNSLCSQWLDEAEKFNQGVSRLLTPIANSPSYKELCDALLALTAYFQRLSQGLRSA